MDMEHQPFKKRVIEQSIVHHQNQNVSSSLQQFYHQERSSPQFYQYGQISENNPQQQFYQQPQPIPQQQQINPNQLTMHQQILQHHQPEEQNQLHSNYQQQQQQQQQQFQHQQQQQFQQLQQQFQPIVHTQNNITNYESLDKDKPMTLNAWTQTKAHEIPSPRRQNELALLAKIRELEKSLRAQTDFINQLKQEKLRTPSPPQNVPNSTTITPEEIKREDILYRILSQSNEEARSGAQFQIELSDDGIPHSFTSSTDSDRLEICLSDENGMSSPRTPEGRLRNPDRPDLETATVSIGPNGTKIPVLEYEQMTWISPSLATRKLLSIIFDQETLATHSMTGKTSPSLREHHRPVERQLDPDAIQDIVFIVSKKCGVAPKEVHSAIKNKCADENKTAKMRALKRLSFSDFNRIPLRTFNKMRSEDFSEDSS